MTEYRIRRYGPYWAVTDGDDPVAISRNGQVRVFADFDQAMAYIKWAKEEEERWDIFAAHESYQQEIHSYQEDYQ